MTEQEKKLKEEHGELFKLTVPLGDGEEVLYLRKLDRKTYKAGAKIMESDELLGAETFLRGLTIAGDVEKVIEDFDAFRAASALLAPIITPREGNATRL